MAGSAIGSQLGLVDAKHSEAITGPELPWMRLSFVWPRKVQRFARASPQNKIQIVKALQPMEKPLRHDR
jgi:magnesium-transporting ATPase (P-type)